MLNLPSWPKRGPRAEREPKPPRAPDPYPGRRARAYARIAALAWALALVVPAALALALVTWPALGGEDVPTVATPDGDAYLVGWRAVDSPAWTFRGYSVKDGEDVLRDATLGRPLNEAGTLRGITVTAPDGEGFQAHANGRLEGLPFRSLIPAYGAPFALLGSFLASRSFATRTTPTRHALDAYRGDGSALAVFLGGVALAVILIGAWWWSPGNVLFDTWTRELRAFAFAWKAGAVNRGAWLMEKGALAGVVALAAFLVWAFPYRMRYPDLLRVAPQAHVGEPAPLGRLFHVQPFVDGEGGTSYRLMYKHAFRLLPPLFVHTVDLTDRPRPWGLGAVVVTSHRLARDHATRGRRRPKADSYAAHALGHSYRDAIMAEDRERQQGRAMAGALMNVDVARAKVRSEPTIMPAARALLREETLKLARERAEAQRRAEGLDVPARRNGNGATAGGGAE